MYEELIGKKLLILGASANEIPIVQRAKELGIYTVVTDYNDPSISPAKLYADEAWNISWSDMDALVHACIKCSIDGVTAGYSEFRIENLIKLCTLLNKPCYCNDNQLEITRNKALFKQLCISNGVPVVKGFNTIESVNKYPVIVKPVDRGGSIGVGIARDYEELKAAYAYAMEKSVCKQVIIEEYISDSVKIDVMYVVTKGNPVLVGSSDTIHSQNNNKERVVQNAWLAPSRNESQYKDKVDSSMKKMIQNIGVKDGFIFFSGFTLECNDNVDFAFFETGLRLSGGHIDNYIAEKGIVNIIDLFIIHALTGQTNILQWGGEVDKDLKCVMVNYYAKSGVASEFIGLDTISKMEDCSFVHHLGYVGQICSGKRAILPKMDMFHFYNHSPDKLGKDIERCNRLYSVKDAYGTNMVYDKLDSRIVSNWWRRG